MKKNVGKYPKLKIQFRDETENSKFKKVMRVKKEILLYFKFYLYIIIVKIKKFFKIILLTLSAFKNGELKRGTKSFA